KAIEQQVDEDVFEEVQEIVAKKEDYREQIRERESIQEKVNTLQMKLETALNELNIGLTMDQLANISFPFYLEEKWNDLKKEAERLRFENEQLYQDRSSLEKQRTFLGHQVAALKKELLTPEQLEELYSQLDAYKEADYRNKLQTESSE